MFIAAGALGFGKIAFGRIPRGERDFQCKKCSVCLIDYHRELGLTFDTAMFLFFGVHRRVDCWHVQIDACVV